MSKNRIVKMGTVCKDKATGLTGTVTNLHCDMSQQIVYLFQPRALNPQTGQPVPKLHLESSRLDLKDDDWENSDIPNEILGSQVTDKATGFSGTAIGIFKHINGCFHVFIQPAGVLERTNSPIGQLDIDIRQLEGEKIPVLTADEIAESKLRKPSPTGDTFKLPTPAPTPTILTFP